MAWQLIFSIFRTYFY